ncbi:STM4014 family protein [Paenibacillus sp. y28]|uniref:STM4014 family protein n=1 Tax=Paenibacillus sp. y28 TaxID=3129110 RepID=UPI00301589E3
MEQLILIGNPDNRRTVRLQEARKRLGLPPAYVLSYLELLRGDQTLAGAAEPFKGAGRPLLLRLDAPGEHFEVERLLIALGAPDAPEEQRDDGLLPFGYRSDPQPMSVRTALALQEQHGRLYHPSQWFRGYGRLLARLEREAGQLWPAARWMNMPSDVIGMFDKRHTHRVLSGAGVPVPRLLSFAEAIPDYEELRETMHRKRLYRVFVKLASGSGACGVIAYQINPATDAELAITTIGFENYVARPPLYYNAIKPRRYTERKTIRQLINWVLQHGAHVEQWVAKASYGERTFDIRQLVVGGEACHSTARLSRTPITNLHLRSERMSLDDVGLSAEIQAAVRTCAERAVSAFSHSSVAGVDVLLSSGTYAPCVVDVNPFGDLLYHVSYEGADTYEWETRRLGGIPVLQGDLSMDSAAPDRKEQLL